MGEKDEKFAKLEGPPSDDAGTKQPSSETEAEKYGYTLGKTLGFGSYANVKEAYSSKFKCRVAMKIINKRTAPRDFLVKFLPREIETTKKLDHKSLVTFYETIETSERVYMAMELCINGDLLDVIQTRKYIRENTAGHWFHQLVDGVDYLHENGIVHRDLKCENLLLDKNDNLKITDFGFARCDLKTEPDAPKILSRTFCGSYAYAPPEILMGIPYEPEKADIWSMGVILFTMLFGKLPFDDANYKNLMKQVKNRVKFPQNPPVPNDCKCLLLDIFTTADKRAGIQDIQKDVWFRKVRPTSKDSLHQGSTESARAFWKRKKEVKSKHVVV